VDHVSIVQPMAGSVYFESHAAFTTDSTAPTVSGASDYPLRLTMMALGSIPSRTMRTTTHT
jgi:hypothetical protein